MKKVISVALIAMLVVAMAGCSQSTRRHNGRSCRDCGTDDRHSPD